MIGLANRPLRVQYHRVRLHRDMSFRGVVPAKSDGLWSLTYWRWRVLERGRSLSEQRRRRQDIDATRQIAALETLGYYIRREFALSDAWDPLPEWVKRLSDKTMKDVLNGADWPHIEFTQSTSNTVHVQIIGAVPLVQEWERTIHEHDAHR
jgi:hypothetical protein